MKYSILRLFFSCRFVHCGKIIICSINKCPTSEEVKQFASFAEYFKVPSSNTFHVKEVGLRYATCAAQLTMR